MYKAVLLCSLCAGSVFSFTFNSQIAADLQPYFLEQSGDARNPGWLGADICTSIPLNATSGTYLYLFGDTLIGSMKSDNTRDIVGMPRGSISVFQVVGREPTAPMKHVWRFDSQHAQHVGFFSPANASNWYWTNVAASAGPPTPGGPVWVIAMEMEQASQGMWGFRTFATAALLISNPLADPFSWNVTTMNIPYMNDDYNISLANGVTRQQPDDGHLYFIGIYSKSGVLGRISDSDALAGRWDQLVFSGAGGNWNPYKPGAFAPALLFDDPPAETTIQFHPYMKQWFLVNANTFTGSAIRIRTAPQLWGPWSAEIPIYQIPQTLLGLDGTFCYACKSHPEYAQTNEIVFSFNCNNNWTMVQDHANLYVPNIIRTTISP